MKELRRLAPGRVRAVGEVTDHALVLHQLLAKNGLVSKLGDVTVDDLFRHRYFGQERLQALNGLFEVVAVSDLIPDRCAGLAKEARCAKTYPSLEELVKDDKVEAVFVATDAPNHVKHVIEVLKHGKHAACAVPACFA